MLKVISFFAALVILVSSCAGTSSKKDTAQEAEDAARAALAEMDGGGKLPVSGAPPGAGSQGVGPVAADPGGRTPAQGATSAQSAAGPAREKPAWVDTPDAVYGKQRYISAVGYGSDRNLAERDALAKLTGVFGQSVQAELKTIANYSEAVKNGAIQVGGDSSVQNAITTSAEMDSLIGAEIADVWYDPGKLYYAAAVMEREKTASLYAELIRSNERMITELVNVKEEDKNTLDAYSRYLLAGTVADANRVNINVLNVVGDTKGIVLSDMKSGDDYRLEAASMVKNIPIGIAVSGDRGDRIKGAFSKALTAAGFRSGGNNSRYMLNVSCTMTEVELPGQQNKFVRYQVNGALADTAEGDSVLLSYDASGREGHLTIPEAEERAIRAAENKIPGEFEAVLKGYLSSLVSRRK